MASRAHAEAGVGAGALCALILPAGLVRWGREVKDEIANLQANLLDTEARNKGMYKEVSLQQRGYCLHVMMVHEGTYWAYQHYR